MVCSRIIISNVRFTSANPTDGKRGLKGWVRCTLNDQFQLDGIAVRQGRNGRSSLSFPARTDGRGRKHFYYHPVDEKTRRAIERQIFKSLQMIECSA